MNEKKVGTLSTISLITGIIGILVVPILFSTTALICGAVALNKKEKYAMIGFILGILGTLWWVVGLIIFLISYGLI